MLVMYAQFWKRSTYSFVDSRETLNRSRRRKDREEKNKRFQRRPLLKNVSGRDLRRARRILIDCLFVLEKL